MGRKEKNRVYRIPWIEVKSEDGHIGEPACVEIAVTDGQRE